MPLHEVNAHGHAQIFGWVALFIMGFAYQAFPRFRHTRLWRPALAVGHRLTFYDASFVALAEHIEGLLVTADATLARPFPRSRVRLLGRDPVPS